MFKSLISAFSMYSKIPMPKIEWIEENRRYSLCFFPLIGLIIGLLEFLWGNFYTYNLILKTENKYCFYISETLYSAVATVIPVIVTGGIHLDGFCDVLDAKNSYADKNRKLEIMKDSHIGAFAVIGLAVYFIMQFGLYSMTKSSIIYCYLFFFIISRALSGIGAITLKCAKKSGTLQSFSEPADKKVTLTVLISIYIFCIAFLFCYDWIFGAGVLLSSLLSFLYYRNFSYRKFGGITGDLAGYFLQICEISMLLTVVLCDIFEKRFLLWL